MKKKNVLGTNVKAVDSPINYKFDKINNKNKKSLYNIRITVPEFTSICPVTGQPDFATIIVDYVPKQSIVESKSFKLFIQSFRNYGIFHEDVTLFIGKQLFSSLKPKWIRVQGFFAPRGGIPIDVFWQSSKQPNSIYLPEIDFSSLRINR
mgnify:FL=1